MRPKLKYVAFAVLALLAFGSRRPCFAAPQEADLRSKTVQMHARFTCAAVTSTHTILVSISSTTVWPNPTLQTGFVNVTNMYIQTDKLAASTVTVKIGVVTAVDSSTGSVRYFFVNASSRNVSNSLNNSFFEADNSFRCLRVNPPVPNSGIDGTTPFLISNENLSGSTIFQNDVLLPAVNSQNAGLGNAFPGLGDVILSIVNSDPNNAVDVYVDLCYHYDSR